MRTKILCAAALAAGALTTMAQVYSANVVGYVNVTVVGGAYNLLANPLNNTSVPNGNNITNLFNGVAQNGDNIFRWNVGTFDFDGVQPTKQPTGWDSNFNANPGEGFFYINNGSDFTVTFVGEVQQGSWTYPGGLGGVANKVAGGYYNALGSPFPLGGSFTNSIIGLPAQNGDNIFTWDVAAFDFAGIQPTKQPTGWDNTQVTIAPGIGFFYINNGSDLTWTGNFTVQ